MKYIVQYKLHAGQIPYFIDDGGYFRNGNKFIGITKDNSECYIPKLLSEGGDLQNYTNQEFINYIKTLKENQEEMEALANQFLISKGFAE